MRCKTVIFILIILIGCKESTPNETKLIDTGGFEIELPVEWKYKKEKGIDSFVGRIVGKEIDLHFDWSEMGYANHLIENETEFINNWRSMYLGYMDLCGIYKEKDVHLEKTRLVKEEGKIDTRLINKNKIEDHQSEIVKTNENFWAIFTHKDTLLSFKIEIPEEIIKHQIEIDTINNYHCKLIRPRNGKFGMTGIYLEDLNSSFNFNLFGENLSLENQERAMKAFQSLKIKRE